MTAWRVKGRGLELGAARIARRWAAATRLSPGILEHLQVGGLLCKKPQDLPILRLERLHTRAARATYELLVPIHAVRRAARVATPAVQTLCEHSATVFMSDRQGLDMRVTLPTCSHRPR